MENRHRNRFRSQPTLTHPEHEQYRTAGDDLQMRDKIFNEHRPTYPIVNKRKRYDSCEEIEKLFEQLSIRTKKTKSIYGMPFAKKTNSPFIDDTYINATCHTLQDPEFHRRIDSSKLADLSFRNLLINSNLLFDSQFYAYLERDELVVYFRKYAYMVKKIFYIELKYEQLNFFYQTSNGKQIWLQNIPRKWARANTIGKSCHKSMADIDRQRFEIRKELSVKKKELESFENEILLSAREQNEQSLDMKLISSTIKNFVRQNQRHMRHDFHWKQEIFMLDLEDHQLVQGFYNLHPTEEQIHSAQLIWRYTKEHAHVEKIADMIKHCLRLKWSSSDFPFKNSHLITDQKVLVTMRSLLNQSTYNPTSFIHWKRIVQMDISLLSVYYSLAEQLLSSIDDKLNTLEQNLMNSSSMDIDTLFDGTSSVEIFASVKQRAEHMHKRTMRIHQQQMLGLLNKVCITKMHTTTNIDSFKCVDE